MQVGELNNVASTPFNLSDRLTDASTLINNALTELNNLIATGQLNFEPNLTSNLTNILNNIIIAFGE